MKVTFGHKPHYERKVTFGEISLKLRQTNWNVARINVNVVVDELPSQVTIYTCLIIDIWTQHVNAHQRGFISFGAIRPKWLVFCQIDAKSLRLYYKDPWLTGKR